MAQPQKRTLSSPAMATRPLIQAFSAPRFQGLDAIDTDPELLADADGTFLTQLVALVQKNDMTGAITHTETHIATHPKNGAVLNILAALHLRAGTASEAEKILVKAARLAPTNQKIITNWAAAQMARQSDASAITLLQSGLRHGTPNFPEYFFNLAVAFFGQEKYAESHQAAQQSLQIDPLPQTYALLAQISLMRNDPKSADMYVTDGLRAFPHHPLLCYFHAECLALADDYTSAMDKAGIAVNGDPHNAHFAIFYGLVLRFFTFHFYNPLHARAISHALQNPHVNYSHFAQAWATLLRVMPTWQPCFTKGMEFYNDDLTAKVFDHLRTQKQMDLPFLTLGLRKLVIRDGFCEQLLTALRRAYLYHRQAGQDFTPADQAFLLALAQQCYHNEYIYHRTPAEEAAIAPPPQTFDDLIIRLCYQSIEVYSESDFLHDPRLADIIAQQITHPTTERALMNQIPSITAIDDDISRAVEQMYMENPYPAWLSVDYAGDPSYLKLAPHKKDRVQVLIAGCGTGHHAVNSSLTHENMHVTAIDLSKRSLAYAKRKTQELGLTHIDYAQADILNLNQAFKSQFDSIECAGVLHHMRDPIAGLRVLLSLLKPGGFLMLGLYSEYARKAMVAGRDLVAAKNYPSTPDGIRALRHDVLTAPADAPTKYLLTRGDFYTISTCRDLVFHVQEHRYTLPQIKQILAEHHLILVRIEADSVVMREFKKEYPQESDLRNLDAWDAFEQKYPQTFGNMYQFWCVKAA